MKWADLIEANAVELAVLGVRNNGTEFSMALKAEPISAAGTMRYFAEGIDKIYGEGHLSRRQMPQSGQCKPARGPNAIIGHCASPKPGRCLGQTRTEFPQFIARVRGADPAAVIRPVALSAIAQATAQGHHLAILSNELDLVYGKDFRDTLPFWADFDLIADASYTGILKPDTRAFDVITDGLGMPASDCGFVDDQKQNLKGAETVGMPFVHFDVTQTGARCDDPRFGRCLAGVKTHLNAHIWHPKSIFSQFY